MKQQYTLDGKLVDVIDIYWGEGKAPTTIDDLLDHLCWECDICDWDYEIFLTLIREEKDYSDNKVYKEIVDYLNKHTFGSRIKDESILETYKYFATTLICEEDDEDDYYEERWVMDKNISVNDTEDFTREWRRIKNLGNRLKFVEKLKKLALPRKLNRSFNIHMMPSLLRIGSEWHENSIRRKVNQGRY